MKKSWIASLLSVALTVGAASAARATMVAGWDFSQYAGSGFLTTNGSSFADVLDANYSDLDSTFNAGAESAAFGIMLMDGTSGASDLGATLGTGTEAVQPLTGSLANNLTAPAVNPFDSHTILASEGQAFQQFLSMTALDAFNIVFKADLSSQNLQGTGWDISLGGKTNGDGTTVGVEFSSDGSSYASAGSFPFTSNDTLFQLALGGTDLQMAFVRLSFSNTGGNAIIDNVSIAASQIDPVPEPGTAALLMVGLAGLARASRRRV